MLQEVTQVVLSTLAGVYILACLVRAVVSQPCMVQS